MHVVLPVFHVLDSRKSLNVQGRRKTFLIRGAGLLNDLCEAQMCGQSQNWLEGPGACPPENFRKTDALRSILVQSEPICSTLY